MITVYKIGGEVIESQLEAFCLTFAAIPGEKILVHGGGKMASELQKSLGQEPVKIEGRRVTDENALKAVVMSYSGWCNKTLTACLQKNGCNAMGLSGCDGNIIRAERRAPLTLSDGVTTVDFGYVGDVRPESVNTLLLMSLLSGGIVPVISPINHDGNGTLLNTNADTVAAAVAAALNAKLVCCFTYDGVLSDITDPSSIIPRIDASTFERMKADGSISEGMIPKIDACLNALRNGASAARITNAMNPSECKGTEICL